MSGIAGWFGGSIGAQEGAVILARMADAIGRGEGLSPVLPLAGNGYGLAARVGLSFADAAEEGGIAAVIHGRPWWDDPELAALAQKVGFAKSLIAAYRRYEERFLRRLKGAFAVAVAEPGKEAGLAAIDRMGIATLVHGRAEDGACVFAAATDGVCAYPGAPTRVSAQAIFNYLFTYTVPAPTAIYEGQSKLLPGEMIVWRQGEATRRFYWTMPYTQRKGASAEDLAIELKAQLADAFARTVDGLPVGDIGAFLSGGLDSSTVAGLMAQHYGGGRTFTIAFNEPAFDESGYARIAAKHFATDHQEYIPTPRDVLDLMPKLAEAYDEPYGNTSAIPAYCCAHMAREAGVKVMLAGDGGDEIFAGNERYAQMQRIENFGRIPRPLRALLNLVLAPQVVDTIPLLGQARRWARRYAIPMPERMFSYGFLGDVDPASVLTAELARTIDLAEPMDILREVYDRPASADMLQRMMHLDLKSALADNDLRKVNRMCAVAGVEVRYPLLDDDLVAFAASVPSRFLLPGADLRRFYKDAMVGFLPPEILAKTKHGFGLPFAQWIKADPPLKSAIEDLVAAMRPRGYFNPAFLSQVQAAVRDSRPTSVDGFAWDIAILELWLERHSDR